MIDTRFGRAKWGINGTRIRTSDENWRKPLKWNAAAAALNTRRKVFTASLADIFEDRDDLVQWRDELHDLIRATPNLDWLVLTKRPEVAARYYKAKPAPANVWLGTSVENRAMAEERIPVLTSIEASIRFLSCEPLLEDLGQMSLKGIDWVIVGGESGTKHRPIDAEWVRSIRDQCLKTDTAFLFKQWGGRSPRKNGNELDGVTHVEFPEPGTK